MYKAMSEIELTLVFTFTNSKLSIQLCILYIVLHMHGMYWNSECDGLNPGRDRVDYPFS